MKKNIILVKAMGLGLCLTLGTKSKAEDKKEKSVGSLPEILIESRKKREAALKKKMDETNQSSKSQPSEKALLPKAANAFDQLSLRDKMNATRRTVGKS